MKYAARDLALWIVLALVPVALLGILLASAALPPARAALIDVLGTQPVLLRNTLAYGLATALVGTLLGWVMAHVTSEYDSRGRTVLRVLALAPLVMPSFVFATALVVVLGHSGMVTRFLGASGVDVYGFWGLVTAGTLARMPYAYLALLWAYRGLDRPLVEADIDLGACRGRVARTVLMTQPPPALVAPFLMLLADALADLANPLVIGGGFSVLATQLYTSASGASDPTTASAYAVLLLVPAIALWGLTRLVGGRQRATVSVLPSPAGAHAPTPRRPPRGMDRLVVGLAWAVAGLIALLLMVVAVGAFVTSFDVDPQLTLAHVRAVLAGQFTRDLATSVFFTLLVLPLALFAALRLAVSASSYRRGPARVETLLDLVGSVPALVWGFAAFLGHQLLVSTGQGIGPAASFLLLGTLLVSVHLIRLGPSLALPCVLALGGLVPDLRDTARSLGASRTHLVRAVYRPRLVPELGAGALQALARTVTAVSSVILLVSPQLPLLPVRALVEIDAGRLPPACAMTLVLGGVVVIGGTLGHLVRRAWQDGAVR